ncbi:MAG: polysaccharide biosynthesis tyrosine autokinase [Fuerstiella sp.]|nr:polysaccharide biosynthesis tyrosine autokinase [Fuerstiella sp.]
MSDRTQQILDNEFYGFEQSDSTSAQQTLQTVLRFLRMVVRHRAIVFGFVAVAVFIGVVHFKRTPKTYMASASMMIRHFMTDGDEQAILARRELMKGYRQLLVSDSVLSDAVRNLTSLPPELQGVSPTELPGRLREMLDVKFDSNQNFVELSYHSQDPESTAAVIEAVIAASQSFISRDRGELANELMVRLEAQSRDVAGQLQLKGQQLLAARKASGDISTVNGTEESHPTVKRVNELSSQLTTSQSRIVKLKSTMRTIRSLASNSQDLSPVMPMLQELVGPELIKQIPGMQGVPPETIRELENSLHDVEAEISVRRVNLGLNHPEIRQRIVKRDQLQKRLNATHQTNRNRLEGRGNDPQVAQWMVNTIYAELNSTLELKRGLESEYSTAAEAAQKLNADLADVRMAEHEVKTLHEQLSTLQSRLKSIDVSKSDEDFRVVVLTDPLVPAKPVAPVLSRSLAISIIFGLFASFAVIYVIDLVDDRLRSPEDVQSQLGLPLLGIIRPLPEDQVAEHPIYVHAYPLTVQTECFRTVRTSISLAEPETKCLAITSSEQSEGKTTFTANLAATFTQTGSRTLLIDADMRRPGLSKLLEIRGKGGLSEILRAGENVPEMCRERIIPTEAPGLDVLPCGPRMMNAGVLLSRPSLAAILDWAVSEYDQVLVDCPPTLPVSDASIVGNYVDGMLFLLNPDKTHRRSALRAVDQLRSVGMNLVGVITNTSSEVHAGAYEYGYGYGQEYTYGHDEHDDENFSEVEDDVVAGASFKVMDTSPKAYSLLSGSMREDSGRETLGDPERKAA